MPRHSVVDKADIADDKLGAGMQPVSFHQVLAVGIVLHPVVAEGLLDAPAAGQPLAPASFQPQFGKVGALCQRVFDVADIGFVR